MTNSQIRMVRESQMTNPECRIEFRRVGRHLSFMIRHGLRTLLLAGATAYLAGCASPGAAMVDLHPRYKPHNIFRASSKLPGEIKRVAVLPLACDGRQTDLAAGRDALEPVLFAELIKAKHFEVVQISREELWRLTGRADWTGEDVLPANILAALKKESGCDAVLFCELTEFRAYPPLAVGWRLILVDARGRKTLWAGDEHFDAGNPAVIAGAQLYQRRGQVGLDDSSGGWLAANSPRRFGQYSIDSLLGTLPAR